MSNPAPSPIDAYLARHNLTRSDFITKAAEKGWTIGRSQLSMICTGYRPAGPSTIALVHVVTDGEVTAAHWKRWRKRAIASRPRRRPELRAS